MRKLSEINIHNLKVQSFAGIIFKSGDLFLTYLTTPVLFGILGLEGFGLWETFLSVSGFILLLDFGIGTGLQNQLVKTIVEKNWDKSRNLVSIAYSALIVLIFIVFIIFLLFTNLVDPTAYIDTGCYSSKSMRRFLFLIICFSFLILSLKPFQYIFNALQLSSVSILVSFLFKLFFLSGISIPYFLDIPIQLKSILCFYLVLNLIIRIIASIILFIVHNELKPQIGFCRFLQFPLLLKTSLPYFIIQLCFFLIVSSDRIIISSQRGSEEVALYSLAYKIIFLGKVFYTQLLNHLWPRLSELYHRKDKQEILSLLKHYRNWGFLINLLIILLAVFLLPIVELWTGERQFISINLIIMLTLFVVLDNIVALYTFFLNAIGKINLQMKLFVLGAVLNIPLSLILVNTDMRSAGVVLSSILCYLPLLILMPKQVLKELKLLND